MNGIELYDILQSRKELAAIPTIIISAHLPMQEIIKRQIIGFKKPFDLQELLDTIQEKFVL
jgi:DNA-binding NtrC family response regulator